MVNGHYGYFNFISDLKIIKVYGTYLEHFRSRWSEQHIRDKKMSNYTLILFRATFLLIIYFTHARSQNKIKYSLLSDLISYERKRIYSNVCYINT